MNKEQLQKDIAELKAKLESMEQQLNSPKHFPQEGETYWYYLIDGEIVCDISFDYLNRINIFKTKAEAEKARDIAFAKARVIKAIKEANNGWEPNWENYKQRKYKVYYHTKDKELKIIFYWYFKNQPNNMYIKSEQLAQQIIENHKEDLMLILTE